MLYAVDVCFMMEFCIVANEIRGGSIANGFVIVKCQSIANYE